MPVAEAHLAEEALRSAASPGCWRHCFGFLALPQGLLGPSGPRPRGPQPLGADRCEAKRRNQLTIFDLTRDMAAESRLDFHALSPMADKPAGGRAQ